MEKIDKRLKKAPDKDKYFKTGKRHEEYDYFMLYLRKHARPYGFKTVKAICRYAGVTQWYLWSILRGKSRMTQYVLKKFEIAYPPFRASDWYISFGIFPPEWEQFLYHRPHRAWHYMRQILLEEISDKRHATNIVEEYDRLEERKNNVFKPPQEEFGDDQ